MQFEFLPGRTTGIPSGRKKSSFFNIPSVTLAHEVAEVIRSAKLALHPQGEECRMGSRLIGLVCRARNAAVLTAGLVLISFAAAQTAALTITETGSTLIFPLFKTWVDAYAKVDPNLHLTVGATGSGAGIAQAIAKQVQIGTSDAYMSDTQAMANPQILNIPLAISAQTVDANLPELKGSPLKLTGPVLAEIYTGKVRTWDAPEIAAINRGVNLPHHAIVPVHRADGSGDTFIFTQFLTFTTCVSGESDDPLCHGTWGDKIGYGTTVPWPSVAGALTANGNQGILQTLARTPYTVGYLGGSFKADADKAGLTTAMLENQSGKFVLPTTTTITAAAASLTPRTPADERLTLVFAPGADSYPLINYEYAVVSEKQANSQVATAISNFLLWCISPQGGSVASLLDTVHFIPLPTAIRARSEIQIAKIQ
jgi:phosphate transport system substrate-binding protein